MSLFWFLALSFLALAFGVLVWTFVWVARLLARREGQGGPGVRQDREAPVALKAPQEPPVGDDPPPDPDAAPARQQRVTATGVNATLGLVLSALACTFFWASPLVLVLSAAGLYFSGNALWFGWRLLGIFILRAAAGVGLGVASAALVFAHRAGAFAELLPP